MAESHRLGNEQLLSLARLPAPVSGISPQLRELRLEFGDPAAQRGDLCFGLGGPLALVVEGNVGIIELLRGVGL